MSDERADKLFDELAKLRAAIDRIDERSRTSTKQLEKIEEKVSDARVAIGKLEVKNGFIATILGGAAGTIASFVKLHITGGH